MKKTIYTDAELLDKLKTGSAREHNDALRHLYQDEVVKNTLKSLAFDSKYKFDRDDILQEAIIKLDESILDGSFRGDSSIRTYLIGICKFKILNQIRRSARTDLREDFVHADLQEAGLDLDKNQEQTFMESECDDLLRGLVKQLTPRCVESLNLYYFEALRLAEVARLRGLANANRAGVAVDQCREQLRQLIFDNPSVMVDLKMCY